MNQRNVEYTLGKNEAGQMYRTQGTDESDFFYTRQIFTNT